MPPLLDDSQLVPDLVATSESSPEPDRSNSNVRSDRAQRTLDILVGVASLIVAAPFLIVAMLAVKLTSRGPVIYCQSRLGRYGRPFVIYKIRSMTHNCEKQSGVKWCTKGDARVTWVGRILRKTHIDELPQLINILRGEMSLVGPRPERPEIVVTLERSLECYRGRLAVRPGLTGLAQVQLPPDTDMESARRKLQYDLHYVTNGTVWMDARLLVSTAFHIVRLPFAFSRLLLGLPGQPEVEPERSVTNPIVDPNADTAVHAICPTTICEVSVDAARGVNKTQLRNGNGKKARASAAVAIPDAYDALKSRVEARTARVGIIGLGYVGLPLARTFAAGGYQVLGFDVDPTKVAKLRRNESYIAHVTPDTLRDMRANGFEATDDFARLADADAVIICVPTPLTESREPDLTYVVKSAEAVAKTLRAGQLVVLESTTYPGTTRKVVLPILEATGLKVGKDFFLGFSPEREDPGNPNFSTPTIPKVVGGLDERTTEVASGLYARVVVNVVPVSSPEVAEACKILENTYRAVNIALVNELKVLYDRMGIDVWEVIDAAKTKPFGFQAFYPGPGLGGHCIPIDPFYLTWVARQFGLTTRFIELAGEVNTAMPAYVVGKIADALNLSGKPVNGSRVLLLGMAYKRDVDDARESPGFEIMELLLNKGARVEYSDPHIPCLPPMRHYPTLRMASQELSPEYLAKVDAVVVVTDHSAFDWEFVLKHAALVVDTRNATRGAIGAARVVRA